jgi:hypothetical protein
MTWSQQSAGGGESKPGPILNRYGVLGELTFPTHPHAAAWHDTALKYMMITLCTESDTHDTRLVDERAVNPWVKAAKLYPANIDDRMSVVMLSGSGIAYQQGSGYPPGISVCSDILCGSFSDQRREFKAGDAVARRVAVFFVEVSAEQTPALAKGCRIEIRPGGSVLHFRNPNSKETVVPLL